MNGLLVMDFPDWHINRLIGGVLVNCLGTLTRLDTNFRLFDLVLMHQADKSTRN